MLENLILEMKRGAKVYIGQVISLIAFILFFVWLPKMDFLLESSWSVVIVSGWLFINALVITVYALYDFITIMLEEQKIEGNLIHTLLFKVFFFAIFFGINMFFVMVTSSVIVPILALMGTFLVLAFTKEYFKKKAPYMCLGILWYIVLFGAAYLGHNVLYVFIYSLIPNITAVGIITTILLVVVTFGIFAVLLKKINDKEK